MDLKVQCEGSDEPKPLKAMIAACDFYSVTGALTYQGRIWVPLYEPLTTALVQNIHDVVISEHPGRDATLAQVSRNYFWPGISKAVKWFCKNCHNCGKSSKWRHQKQGLLKSLPVPVPERFHQELSIDFMVDLPISNGITNKMALTYRFLKSVTLEGTDKTDAESFPERFLNCH